MAGKKAALLLSLICVLLAALLLSGAILSIVAGGVFAVALLVLGLASGGFRRGSGAERH